MDKNAVKECLSGKGVNPLLLENPAFDMCANIINMARKTYYRLPNKFDDNSDYDEMIQFYLDTGISVDEKGNVSMLDTVEKDHSIASTSRKKQTFSINEDGEFIFQYMYKICYLGDKNELDQYRTSICLTETVYNQAGIEMVRWDKECNFYKVSMDDAMLLAENDEFLSSDAYDQFLITSYDSISVREIKRNYDLGSVRVEYRGGLKVKEDFECNVRLLEGYIEHLMMDYDAMTLLSKISKVSNLDEWKKANPCLNFGENMSAEERNVYYEKINDEIALILDLDKRDAMYRMAQERGILSSNLDEQPIVSDQNKVNVRTMGFGALWILGLITGILSFGILIVGILLR